MIETVYSVIDGVRREVAPDARTEIFEVEAEAAGDGLVLTGWVSVPSAVELLVERLGGLRNPNSIKDLIERVGIDPVRPNGGAIVTAATAPALAGPLISEPSLSQVPLGHPLRILRHQGRWCQCRMADGNLGWFHRGYLRQVDEDELAAWTSGAAAPVHVSLGCEIHDPDGRLIYRLPLGARFGLRGEQVLLPDGRTGGVRGASVPAAELDLRYPPNGDAILASARCWIGTPYHWGGVTPWGADCSGMVQTIFGLHGIPLPRDSDQQAEMGDEVGVHDLRALEAGDLVFFAEQGDRISHVAISAGGTMIIHAALSRGGVIENDLAADADYERELRSYFVGTRRVIPRES